MTDAEEIKIPVCNQSSPTAKPHHEATKSLEMITPSGSSRSSGMLSKSIKSCDTTTTGTESRRSTKSSVKSCHLPDSSRKSSSHNPSNMHRSGSLPTNKMSSKKNLSLFIKQEPTKLQFASPRSSIVSASGTPVSDSPSGMRYTSIDLENELPEIFSSSLNPAIQDPDMTEYYSRSFFKTKSHPPLYISRKASMALSVASMPSHKNTAFMNTERRTRMKIWLTLFIAVFFLFPILIIIIFHLLPHLVEYLDKRLSPA